MLFRSAVASFQQVADGSLDGFMDCSPDAHGVWDYLGSLLICQEAGAVVTDIGGLLSHATIVARDLGMTVVAVYKAKSRVLELIREAETVSSRLGQPHLTKGAA